VAVTPRPDGRAGAVVGDLVKPITSVESGAHLALAAQLLNRFGEGALLVTPDDGSEPVALISAADISRAVGGGWAPSEARVGQVVAGPPMTVDAALPVREAARTMLSSGVEHLLVRRGNRILGVVHLVDVCEWLLRLPAVGPRARQPAVGTRVGQAPTGARGHEAVEDIGPLVRNFRLAADLTLEGLSAASGISARALSDIERGVARGPQRRTVVAIAGALNLSGRNRAALFHAARAGRRRSQPDCSPLLPAPRRPSESSGAER
jgi:CBS domain-containing protein/transcriptional regulator with XRE-family HTH domain